MVKNPQDITQTPVSLAPGNPTALLWEHAQLKHTHKVDRQTDGQTEIEIEIQIQIQI